MKKIVLTWLALCAALFGAWQLQALGVPQFKSLHIERLLVSPASAYWQSRDSNYNNISAAAPVSFAIAYEGNSGALTSVTGCNTNCLISGLTLGSPGVHDIMVATLCGRYSPSPTLSSPLINGVSATLVSSATISAGMSAWIWYATGVSGATGTIGWAQTTALTRIVAAIYKVTTSTTGQTPAGNATTSVATGTTVTAAVTVPSGGGAIANACTQTPVSFAFTAGVVTTDTNINSTNQFLTGNMTGGSGSSTNFSAGTGSSNTTIDVAAFTP